MMPNTLRILSWNIQSGRGCDGRVEIARIIDHMRAQGPLDLICLQEVARHFPEYTSAEQPDQLQALVDAFPDFVPAWGAALSWPGTTPQRRREFGNLTLTRRPLLDRRIHVLPATSAPSSGQELQTPRCAVETLIEGDSGPLRILNAHLAFHDAHERRQQLAYLSSLQQREQPQTPGPGIYAQPFHCVRTLLCGDLNMDSRHEHYRWLATQGWQDAWQLCHGDRSHQPTCGIHDLEQWPQGPHCRDYFWLQQLRPLGLYVDTSTNLSDHQPLILTLEH